jgi:hypothetical protein
MSNLGLGSASIPSEMRGGPHPSWMHFPKQARLLAAALAVGAATLLTGCSAAAPQAAAAAQEKTPTPTPTTVDLRPWVALINKQKSDYADWKSDWDGRTCSALATGAVDCNAELTAATFIAQTISLNLTGATRSSSPTYKGEVPAEVGQLYGETKRHAADAAAIGEKWSDKCVASGSTTCLGKAFKFEQAFEQLEDDWAAWEAYS